MTRAQEPKTTEEAAAAAGIQTHQVRYLVKRGAILPSIAPGGTGNRWKWTAGDIRKLSALARKIEECPFAHGHKR